MAEIVPLDRMRAALGVGISVTDDQLNDCALSAEGAILPLLRVNDSEGDPIDYSSIPQIVTALTNAAVEIYRYERAPGGNISSVDMIPQPFMLGRYFTDKFSALLTGYVNPKTLLG